MHSEWTGSSGQSGNGRLHAFALWAIVLSLAAFAFHDYHTYIQETASHPDVLPDLLAGRGLAPQQYRMAIPTLARFLHGITHLSYDLLFGVVDFLSGVGTALAIYTSLRETTSFAQSGPAGKLARIGLLLTLLLYFLSWSLRYQRPDTLTCALYVSLAAVLLSRGGRLALPGVVVLSVLQGFVRADIAILFNVGLFLAALFGMQLPGQLRRVPTLLASLVGAVASLAILAWLARMVYPHATYGATAVVQLRGNLSGQLFPFLLFLSPLLIGVWLWVGSGISPGSRYLVLGAALFLVSWFVMGRAQEVRIFVPFAIALIPLTTTVLADHLLAETESGRGRVEL